MKRVLMIFGLVVAGLLLAFEFPPGKFYWRYMPLASGLVVESVV